MKMPKPTLQIDEIVLRQWTEDDAQWYMESRDEEVFKWTTEKRNLTVHDAIEGIKQANETDNIYCFAIVDNDSGRLQGNIALVLEAENQRSGELMFWLAPSGRGRGIAVRAARRLCQWAFTQLNMEKITAKTLPDNYRSQKVLQSLAFQPDTPHGNRENDERFLWFSVSKQAFSRVGPSPCRRY